MEMLFDLLAAHTSFSLQVLTPKKIAGKPGWTCPKSHRHTETDDTTAIEPHICTLAGYCRPLSSLICEVKSLTTSPIQTLLRHARPPGQEVVDPRTLARQARLLQDLSTAQTYKQRRSIQKQLYHVLGLDLAAEAVRRESLFDVRLVRSHSLRLEAAMDDDDLPLLLGYLRTGLRRDLGGICNPELYDSPGVPTEPTIARYQKTVLNALNAVVAACLSNDDRIDKHYALQELKCITRTYGNTALCCSGGGTLGMMHVGVIKALRDAGRLPRVVSGSSAGAIVCAILCTRTDEELPIVLEEFVHGDLAVFVGDDEPPGWLARGSHFWKNGVAFDSRNLERVMKKHLGDMTFQEAYSRTGKELNITVSTPKREDASRRVLNRKHCPNVVIWSAVVASCALPYAFRSGRLTIKDTETRELHTLDGDDEELIDGSFQGDIPLQRLADDFGSTYFIVAQNNPHVLIAWRLRQAFGEGTLGKTVDYLSNSAVRELCHVLPRLGYLGNVLASILDQPYSGDITISPELSFANLLKVLCNPTPDFMEAARRTGEEILEPYLPMIKNHVKIERALAQACRDLEEACHFSDSQNDLRRLHLEHAARFRRRRGSTQSVPGVGTKPLRTGSVGGHKRSKTTTIVVEERNQQPSTTHGDVVDHSTDSSACERRAKFSLDFDDESEKVEEDDSATSQTPPQDSMMEEDIDMEPDLWLLQWRSAPSSPRPTLSTFLGSPTRSDTPSVTPFSLVMTPASERSVSPEMRRPMSPEWTPSVSPAPRNGRQNSAGPTRQAARVSPSKTSPRAKHEIQSPATSSKPRHASKPSTRHTRKSSAGQ